MPALPSFTPISLLIACVGLTAVFTLAASVDGLYLHLWRYRLHARPDSRTEHWLHTANALLFPPLTYLLLSVEPLGLFRWLALALLLLTLLCEALDVLCERRSRASLGGLTQHEYLLHFLMSGLRGAGVAPLLLVAPLWAWAPGVTALAPRPWWCALFSLCLIVPGIAIAALHLLLAVRKLRPRGDLPLL